MSRAIAGDPLIDEAFGVLLDNTIHEVDQLVKRCYANRPGKRNMIHNLNQKHARDGSVGCGHMISQLVKLQADLLATIDIRNEQGRGGQASAAKRRKADS